MYDNVRRRLDPDTIVADEKQQANDSVIIQTFHLFVVYKNLELGKKISKPEVGIV